ncbi:MAG: hypothetical protein F4169_07600 [Gammaproteobacteria bacterium]|nr:hypothetical protein [Gammaproteobacteria bacterium]
MDDVDIAALERQFHQYRRRRCAHRGHAFHELIEARQVQRAVLHADIEVVRPGRRRRDARFEAEFGTGVVADIERWLVIGQAADGAVEAIGHHASAW